jgi:hypothetical protein
MGLIETIKGTQTINLNETSEKKSIVKKIIYFIFFLKIYHRPANFNTELLPEKKINYKN